ncbi:MAG: hypothetical protein MUE69_17795 [Myxococcota bacterium]|nr:hypothetical protein [Myxococcota bacterium]
MRRWTAAIVLACAASVSAWTLPLHAQAPEPAPNAPASEAPPVEDSSTEGARPSDDPSSAATPNEAAPNEATPAEAAPNEATPAEAAPNEAAPSPTTPSAASAHGLARPIAPPPPPVGFDDERAAPPTEEPRPRSALRERFVIFSPGWMPIVTLGYRAQIVRYRGGSVSRSDTSHGLTSGVLAPVLATGDSSSRVRLALGVGMGLDVAWRSEGPGAELDAVVTAGDDPVYTSPAYVERALSLSGQMGALAQIALGRSRLTTSLVWLPTRRFVRVREDGVGVSFGSAPSDYSSRAFKRFRFNVGLVRAGFLVSAFLGGGSVAARGSAREIEAGIQLGIAR